MSHYQQQRRDLFDAARLHAAARRLRRVRPLNCPLAAIAIGQVVCGRASLTRIFSGRISRPTSSACGAAKWNPSASPKTASVGGESQDSTTQSHFVKSLNPQLLNDLRSSVASVSIFFLERPSVRSILSVMIELKSISSSASAGGCMISAQPVSRV